MATDSGVVVFDLKDLALTPTNEIYLPDHSATSIMELEDGKLVVPISHESLDYLAIIDREKRSHKLIKHYKKTWTSQLIPIAGCSKAILVRDLGSLTIVDLEKEQVG